MTPSSEHDTRSRASIAQRPSPGVQTSSLNFSHAETEIAHR
eukprot:CAMPEP_0118937686 /NCGR_PEP_ID=MMETSP1169-20130426/23514_1 /TAXON_ID=36882 /ORGANISM="Pyramimonas obovata, Strain CCMP722" /LENGTH=40 /DNA_ID= /DNA_START= /DNA_END= /DNA_ORIENTATION=